MALLPPSRDEGSASEGRLQEAMVFCVRYETKVLAALGHETPTAVSSQGNRVVIKSTQASFHLGYFYSAYLDACSNTREDTSHCLLYAHI